MSKGMSPGEFKVVDEYKNPSGHATGGHIHVEFANHQAASKYASLSGNAKPGNVKKAEAEAEPKDKQAKPITPPSSTEVTGKNPSAPSLKTAKIKPDADVNAMESDLSAMENLDKKIRQEGSSKEGDNLRNQYKKLSEEYHQKYEIPLPDISTRHLVNGDQYLTDESGRDYLEMHTTEEWSNLSASQSPSLPNTKPQEPELSAPTSRMAESPKMPEPKEEVKPKMVETETDLSKALDRIASMAERQSQKIESIISVKKPGTRNVEQIAKSMS